MHDLKYKGITVPLTDALIAVIAKRHRVDVVTLDKHLPVVVINPLA